MEYRGVWVRLLLLLLWILSLTGDIGRSVAEVLRCYDCSDTFKTRWNPYTDCQLNVSAVPIATCLDTDQYCKVERVTVKGTGATISILRSCAGECYYGCRLLGYGVSQLRCTSCCNGTLCNTGSGAGTVLSRTFLEPGRGIVTFSLLGMAMVWTIR